jgi:hypothetical protein
MCFKAVLWFGDCLMIDVDILAEPSPENRQKIGFMLCAEVRHIPPDLPDDDQEIMRDLSFKEEMKMATERAVVGAFVIRDELDTQSPQIDHIKKLYPRADDQSVRDIRLLGQAVKWAFAESDLLAVEFMRHFLDRDEKRRGHTVKIRMADLLSQDQGARSRVFQAVRNRIAADRVFQASWKYLPGIFGGQHDKHPLDPHLNSSLAVIMERQSEYSTSNWRNALGSFQFFWTPVSDQRRRPDHRNSSFYDPHRYVWVWGEKRAWRWHTQTQRGSIAVHQAGARLAKAGIGRYYRVVGEACVLDLTTGYPVLFSMLGNPPLNDVTKTA